jgi:transposase
VKTDRTDARALAEMLQSGWYWAVYLKSEESHRRKALLSARDQLVRNKRSFFGQIRGLLRPFGIRLGGRMGTSRFDQAARAAKRLPGFPATLRPRYLLNIEKILLPEKDKNLLLTLIWKNIYLRSADQLIARY